MELLAIVGVVFVVCIIIMIIVSNKDRNTVIQNFSQEIKELDEDRNTLEIIELDVVQDTEYNSLEPWMLAKNEEDGEYCLARRSGERIDKKYLFNKRDIIYCEIDIDEQMESSGGLGSAVLGGLIFGGFGAVTGAILGKKAKEKTKNITLYIGTRNSEPIEIEWKASDNIDDYKKEAILKTYHLFSSFAENNKQSENNNSVPVQVKQGVSVADEIEKLHELYKQGILSQEELEQGKRKLLQ